MKIIPTLLILSGGKGERLKPLTIKTHKSLTKINNKPILQYLIEYFLKKKFKKFIFATGYKSKQIENFLKLKFFNLNYKIINSGNTGIINRLKDVCNNFDDNLIVCYGDTLANININKYLSLVNKNKRKIIITVYQPEIKFGVVDLGKKNLVNNFKEKPKLNLWINIGYIFIPKEFSKHIKKSKDFVLFLKKQIANKNVIYFKHNNLHITVNTISELNDAKRNIKNFR